MPAKKKSSPRSRTSASSRRTTSRSTSTRKTAPRRAPARRAPARRPRAEETPPDADERSILASPADEETPAGPVVVGEAGTGAEAPTEVLEGVTSEPGAVETYREDLPVALLSAVLVASTFLPWYTYKFSGRSATVSGFATGTWGPMIAFLGLLSLALVVLRRAHVRVGLPISDTHIHEAVGWLSIAGAVVKFRLVPSIRSYPMTSSRSYGVYVAIGSAFLLAFVAGRMSGSTPFVTLPKWYKGRAGTIGAALLLLAVGGAAAFGAVNNVNLADVGRSLIAGPGGNPVPNPTSSIQSISGKFPKCAAGFPLPKNAKPQQAVEKTPTQPNCVFTYTTTRTVASMLAFYKGEFQAKGWTFREVSNRTGSATVQSTNPCATVTMTEGSKKGVTNVIVATADRCAQPSSSPGSSQSPSSVSNG